MNTTKERDGNSHLSRRAFLKSSALIVCGLALPPRFTGKISHPESAAAEAGEPGLEIINVEERRGILQLERTPVLFLPLRDDFFIDQERQIEEWSLSNVSLGFGKIITLRGGDGTETRVAPFYHTMGLRVLPMAILDRGGSINFTDERKRQTSLGHSAKDLNGREVFAEFALLGSFYPNKHHNILEGAAQILRFQMENERFLQGQTYSLLDILDIEGESDFELGMNSMGERVVAGGVCAFATAMSHTLSQTEIVFDERHSHYLPYWVGPLDENVRIENDATVSDGSLDLRWTPSNDFYLSLATSLTTTGNPNRNGFGEVNSQLIVHFTLTSERPPLESQLERIVQQQNAYGQFNLRGETSEILQEQTLLGTYPLTDESSAKQMFETVYIEEDRTGFNEEIESSPYLRDILTLQEIVRSYRETYPDEGGNYHPSVRLGNFIRENPWYSSLSEETKERLHFPLGLMSQDTYNWGTGEALQCIAWVIFLSNLDYNESPLDISGFTAQDEQTGETRGVLYARELIPPEMYDLFGPRSLRRGSILYNHPTSVDEFEVGDLFVNYNALNFLRSPGHVGAIVGKKSIDGKTTLLVSDANRWRSGVIRLFRVDRSNDYAIFGRPPAMWTTIRRV